MSNVKRYGTDSDYADLHEFPSGYWVRYSDYAALEEENARLWQGTRVASEMLDGVGQELIQELKQERDALKAQVERLTAPVSDAEWSSALRNYAAPRAVFDGLIAARASQSDNKKITNY